MGKIVRNREVYSGTYDSATSVNYNNTTSGLSARTVQEAVDEVQGNVNTLNESLGIQIKEIGNTVIEVAKGSSTYGSETTATGTVTFKNTYAEIPCVFISPYGSNSMNIQFVAYDITTTGFKIYVINRGGAPINARFNYMVL